MALEGYKDMATNRGFRMKDSAMYVFASHLFATSSSTLPVEDSFFTVARPFQ